MQKSLFEETEDDLLWIDSNTMLAGSITYESVGMQRTPIVFELRMDRKHFGLRFTKREGEIPNIEIDGLTEEMKPAIALALKQYLKQVEAFIETNLES